MQTITDPKSKTVVKLQAMGEDSVELHVFDPAKPDLENKANHSVETSNIVADALIGAGWAVS